MDPDAVLAKIREILQQHPERFDDERFAELANSIEALDYWLSRGGFLPQAWRRE